MSGLVVVGGTSDARAKAAQIVASMAGDDWSRDVLDFEPDLALGKARRGKLGSDRAPLTGNDGVTVAVDGEIFDDDGPVDDPGATIAAHYRDGTLDRVAHLNGSFAAIIVDCTRRRVVLASDRLGSRSLFWWRNGRGFAAASALGGLLQDERVPRRLDLQSLAELTTYHRTVLDHTHYADVRALPAASVTTIDENGATTRQTRRLAWRRNDRWSEDECAEALHASMTKATARRLADPVRHGLLLSGGLDARWVLSLARNQAQHLPCVTVASHRNFEVAVAERCAALARMPFTYVESPPSQIASRIDDATEASDGLFTAPVNLFGAHRLLAREHDVLFSGHGLDYTFRGYYMPCVMWRVAGSTTRLPRLRAIPDGSAKTVARNLRVGGASSALERILRPERRAEWETRQVAALEAVLGTVDIESPYDAWDAFILHCLGRHLAYSDFVALRRRVDERAVTFDPDVLDIYLAMQPAWRASGRVAHKAMQRAGSDLMALPDANSGFSARFGFASQIALLYGRAVARRLGIARRPPLPDPTMSHGSWANFRELLRRDPTYVERLRGLSRSVALLDMGIFDDAEIERVVDAHLSRREDHVKLLLALLSIDSWLTRHGYTSVHESY